MIRLVLLFTIFFTNLAFAQDNFLVIVADDVGVDKVTVYGEGVNPPATPNIDGLAADGVLFRNAWASPLCSTSRVSTLTGKYAFRHGTGKLLGGAAARKGLDPQVTNIANVLKSNGYDTAAFGKWHMRGCSTDPNGDCDGSPSPTLAESAIRNGFDYFAGNLGNVGPVGDYCDWNKTEASRTGPGDNDIASTEFVSNDYLTTVTTDDAISHMSTMTEPWFSWVAYNASHAPYHEIPSPETNCTLTVTGDNTAMFDAMTEKMDSEIGRLLASLDPAVRDRTTIIFIGDNGTPGAVVVPPFTKARSKATVYEGGVGVPFIVVGPDVATPSINQESQALVHVVDIFDTVMDIAGLDPCNGVSNCAEDSISFLPSLQDYTATSSRTLNFSETFSPNQVTTAFAYPEEHEQAISDGQFKIVRFYDRVVGTTEFYDLSTDAFESTDLLTGSLDSTQTAAFNALASSYTSLTGICLDLNDLDGDCVNDTVDNCPAAPNGPLGS
jgi:arylsulfatase A-like enzyme